MRYSIEWSLVRSPGTVLVGRHFEASEPEREIQKVALFDLNGTIMVSKSGLLHGRDEHDWKWWHETVPSSLSNLHQEGYQVVIVSNQGRLTLNGKELAEAKPFKVKMELVMRALRIPVTVMVAGDNDLCRKPRIGMWSLLGGPLGNTKIDKSQSFMVGDAAGREKDFSDNDRHFGMNLQIGFFTPEEFFRGGPAQDLGHKFDPAWYSPSKDEGNKEIFEDLQRFSTKCIIILVGLPGAGKTTYYRRFLEPRGYIRVAPQAGTSIEAFLDAAREVLAQRKPVVVDAASVDMTARKIWISLAQKTRVCVRALEFTTSKDLCLHNDSFRALGGVQFNPEKRPIYPRLPFLDLVSSYEEPSIKEGFESITKIDFQWHGTDEALSIWKRYWH